VLPVCVPRAGDPPSFVGAVAGWRELLLCRGAHHGWMGRWVVGCSHPILHILVLVAVAGMEGAAALPWCPPGVGGSVGGGVLPPHPAHPCPGHRCRDGGSCCSAVVPTVGGWWGAPTPSCTSLSWSPLQGWRELLLCHGAHCGWMGRWVVGCSHPILHILVLVTVAGMEGDAALPWCPPWLGGGALPPHPAHPCRGHRCRDGGSCSSAVVCTVGGWVGGW